MQPAAIYTRISADREGERLGVERQEHDAQALAASLGLTVAEVYTDNDISASTRSRKSRPEYERMLAAAEAGQIGHIIAYSNSRLTRRPRELEALVELAERRGTRIHTVVSGQYDLSTADGRLHARLLGSIDAAEAERTGERVSRAARQAAEAGKWNGGVRPFGYTANGMALEPAAAAALRDSYTRVLSGESLASIGRRWNAAGFTTGRGNTWTTPAVREVLCNPRNAGLRAYRGDIVGPARWPAVVDREVWEAVSAMLRAADRRHGPKGGRRFLTGLAVCGVCGETVFASGGTAEKPVYRCRAGKHFARQAEPIERYVEDLVVWRLGQPDVTDALLHRSSGPNEELRTEARVLRSRLESLAVDFADGALTVEQVRAATERLRGRLSEVELRLASAMTVSPLAQFVGEDASAIWAGMDVDVRRAVIEALARVVIFPTGRGARGFDPTTVVIEWLDR